MTSYTYRLSLSLYIYIYVYIYIYIYIYVAAHRGTPPENISVQHACVNAVAVY